MYIAKHFPGRIQKLITLATKFHWDEKTAGKENSMLDANAISEKNRLRKRLAQRHVPNDWKQVLDKTKQMLLNLGRKNCLDQKVMQV